MEPRLCLIGLLIGTSIAIPFPIRKGPFAEKNRLTTQEPSTKPSGTTKSSDSAPATTHASVTEHTEPTDDDHFSSQVKKSPVIVNKEEASVTTRGTLAPLKKDSEESANHEGNGFTRIFPAKPDMDHDMDHSAQHHSSEEKIENLRKFKQIKNRKHFEDDGNGFYNDFPMAGLGTEHTPLHSDQNDNDFVRVTPTEPTSHPIHNVLGRDDLFTSTPNSVDDHATVKQLKDHSGSAEHIFDKSSSNHNFKRIRPNPQFIAGSVHPLSAESPPTHGRSFQSKKERNGVYRISHIHKKQATRPPHSRVTDEEESSVFKLPLPFLVKPERSPLDRILNGFPFLRQVIEDAPESPVVSVLIGHDDDDDDSPPIRKHVEVTRKHNYDRQIVQVLRKLASQQKSIKEMISALTSRHSMMEEAVHRIEQRLLDGPVSQHYYNSMNQPQRDGLVTDPPVRRQKIPQLQQLKQHQEDYSKAIQPYAAWIPL